MFFQYCWEYEGTKSIWVMPKSLLAKNRDEILRFTDFREEHVRVIEGPPKKRAQIMADENAVVFLATFDFWRDHWETLLAAQPKIDLLAGDEVHMGWKSPESKRVKGLFRSMRRVRRFLAMTGTLINGRLDSAFPVIHVIEPRYYVNHSAFWMQHAEVDLNGDLIFWKNHDKLGRIFQRHAVRKAFIEVHGAEQKVIEKRECEMTATQRKAYDELERDAMVELEDTVLDGSLPGVAVIRCRQIMAHPETFGIHKPGIRTGKDEQLEIELADHYNTGAPLVIFASLVPEQQRILEIVRSWGMTAEIMTGDTSGKQRERIDRLFREGQIQVVVCSPKVASVGFNWGHVDHMVFASLDYDDDSFFQAYRRGMRSTRTCPLRITVLQYRKSMDQRIFQIVDRKSAEKERVDATYERLSLSQKQYQPAQDELTLENF